MNRTVPTAMLLVALLGFAGCFGAVEPDPPEEKVVPIALEQPVFEWINPASTIQLDGTPIVLQVRYAGEGWKLIPTVTTPIFESLSAYGWSVSPQGYSIEFLPSMVGNYTVGVAIEPLDSTTNAPEIQGIEHRIEVTPPVESAPVVQTSSREIL